MQSIVIRALAGVCLFAQLSLGGQHGDQTAVYQRLICVVPLVGAGTLNDPKRPGFAPISGFNTEPESLPLSSGFTEKPEIIAYHSLVTDDGGSAIVEFVARDRAAFRPLLKAGRRKEIQVFDRNIDKREDVLNELRKWKKDFDFSMLRVGVL